MRISDWSSDLFSSDLKNDGVEVRFVSGDTEKYDIVIGADGLHSNVRSPVFGHESQFERYLGFCFAGFTMPNKLDLAQDRQSTRLNSSHYCASRMPSSA